MKHLLWILYGAGHLKLNFEEVYNVVTLAKKYLMATRLNCFGAQWLRSDPFDKSKGPDDIRECWEKMVIAYMLGDGNAFFRTSYHLCKYGDGVVEWGLNLADQELGIKLARTFRIYINAGSICAN